MKPPLRTNETGFDEASWGAVKAAPAKLLLKLDERELLKRKKTTTMATIEAMAATA
jgi:hypothetical protein